MINAIPDGFFRFIGLRACARGHHKWVHFVEGAPEDEIGGMSVIYGRKVCARCEMCVGFVQESIAPIYTQSVVARRGALER
jgi:hypothetical protein